MTRLNFILAALALAGCGPAEQPGAAAPNSRARAAAGPSSPYGVWRIVEVNERPAKTLRSDEPTLTLEPRSYQGNAGCNSFGGTSVVQAGRFFADPGTATEMGCGELTAQEKAVHRILTSGPRLASAGRNRLRLEGPAGRLLLQRTGQMPRPDPTQGPATLLAGTRWTIIQTNGAWVGTTIQPTPILQFEADEWSLSAPCGKLTGRWRQPTNGAVLAAAAVPAACAEDVTVRAMRRMFDAPLAYSVHNSALVLAGAGNFISARSDLDFGAKDPELLTGEWRVVAIDGRPPNRSPRPPSLIFTRTAYGAWDGCNHREGIYLTNSRQLFALGSGLSTLANCLREQISPKVNAVLAGQPRIARTATGIALVSRTGRLDLERMSARTHPSNERSGLWPGLSLDLAVKDGPARLILGHDRSFAIRLPCGTLRGNWRPGQPAGFTLEPAERHAPACPAGPDSAFAQMQRVLGGEVQAVIDANNERALLLNENRVLSGRVVRE